MDAVIVVFGTLFLAAWLKARLWSKEPLSASITNRIIGAFLSLMSLGFLTLASTAIEPFGCRRENPFAVFSADWTSGPR